MPDPDVYPLARDFGVQMNYRNEDDTATLSLRERIIRKIADHGPLPVPEYLEQALYDPELGYYAQGGHRVGKAGDFFTSVSVGPVFGGLLARRMARHYRESGTPDRWRVRELGANDGRLAADILDALARIDPQAMAALEYEICEPLPLLREIQRARLATYENQVKIVTSTENDSDNELPGLVFGNEVLDALPFHMVEWKDGDWREKRIGVGEYGKFQLILAGGPAADVRTWLEASTRGMSLPDGWQCEVRTGWRAFLESSLRGMINPLVIWIDYGFLRSEYIRPHRTEGTWRAYRNHQIETDPWNDPGTCDLTAHVDFTGVIEAVESLGGRLGEFTPQGTWLTRLALDDLASREGKPDPAWTRQFQTLTHPAHLGTKFHVLECMWKQSNTVLASSR